MAAERRKTESVVLARTLRGDLDWIAMKALEKDPENEIIRLLIAETRLLTGEVGMVPDPSRPLRESDVAVVLGRDEVLSAMLRKADQES